MISPPVLHSTRAQWASRPGAFQVSVATPPGMLARQRLGNQPLHRDPAHLATHVLDVGPSNACPSRVAPRSWGAVCRAQTRKTKKCARPTGGLRISLPENSCAELAAHANARTSMAR